MLNRYKLSLQIEAIYYETPIQFAKGFTFVRTLHCEVCRHFFPSLPALLNDSLALISCYLQAEAIYFRNAEKIHNFSLLYANVIAREESPKSGVQASR